MPTFGKVGCRIPMSGKVGCLPPIGSELPIGAAFAMRLSVGNGVEGVSDLNVGPLLIERRDAAGVFPA